MTKKEQRRFHCSSCFGGSKGFRIFPNEDMKTKAGIRSMYFRYADEKKSFWKSAVCDRHFSVEEEKVSK